MNSTDDGVERQKVGIVDGQNFQIREVSEEWLYKLFELDCCGIYVVKMQLDNMIELGWPRKLQNILCFLQSAGKDPPSAGEWTARVQYRYEAFCGYDVDRLKKMRSSCR